MDWSYYSTALQNDKLILHFISSCLVYQLKYVCQYKYPPILKYIKGADVKKL